jgi:hypothetical protein
MQFDYSILRKTGRRENLRIRDDETPQIGSKVELEIDGESVFAEVKDVIRRGESEAIFNIKVLCKEIEV